MKYALVDSSKLSSVDFNQVKETSSETVRFSNDQSKFLAKWDGVTPSFIDNETEYTIDEVMPILDSAEWVSEE